MEVVASRIIIGTDEFDVMRRFYESTLGLRISREYGVGGRVTGVVYFMGGGFLELTDADEPSPPVMLWLQVPDLEAEQARLHTLDVEIIKSAERMPWGLLELWMHDPQGNELRLIEVPPDHPLRRRV